MNQAVSTRRQLGRFVGNAASLLASDVLNKATTFIVYAMVSRYLGAKEFGQLSLGLLLLYVFQVLATAGLPNLITRSIARRPTRTARYLSHGLVTTAMSSVAATLLMLALPWLMAYDRDTATVISLLAMALAPYALALVIEATFRGNQRMHLIAVSNLLANSLKIVGAVYLLHSGYGIFAVAALLACVRGFILLSDLILYRLTFFDDWVGIRWSFVMALSKRTSTFLGIDVVIAVWAAVDALLLSKLMTEVEVGLYSAAAQLLQPVALVYRSIVGSLFPAMCAKAIGDVARLVEMTRWLSASMLLIGLPVAVLIPQTADWILWLAYQAPEFQRSVPVLQIAAVSLVNLCLTSILGHTLWAANRERATLRIVTINLLVHIVINAFLISNFGLIGAAVGSLLVACLNSAQHYWACYRLLGQHPVDHQVIIPLAATSIMALVVFTLDDHSRVLALSLGLTSYLLAVAVLLLIAHRGLRNLRRCFFAPLLSQ